VIFVDESEFVPESLWINTILPLMMQPKTSILAATSPQDNTSYHAFMINVTDKSTGQKVFNVVNLMEVCDACLKTETPWTCVHAQDRLSWSKSKAARDETSLFYRKGQDAVRGRELFGIANKNTSNLLPSTHVDLFFNSSIHITEPARVLYLAIDPGGGGPGELGLVGVVDANVMVGPAGGSRLAVSSNAQDEYTQWNLAGVAGDVGQLFSNANSDVK
jgi:hypothetical protein